MKLSDARTIGADPRLSLSSDVANTINSQDLMQTMDRENVLIHVSKSLQDSLLQRTYTFVPGVEGFPEEYAAVSASLAPRGAAPSSQTEPSSHISSVPTPAGQPFALKTEKRRKIENIKEFEMEET